LYSKIMDTEQYFGIVRQRLKENGSATVRVTGVSMMPLLRHLKDAVVFVPAKEIRPGDVVLFDRKTGRYALHRVISIRGDRFSMMGDNQWYMDRDLPLKQIVGKVSYFIRGTHTVPSDGIPMRAYAALAIPAAYVRWMIGAAKRRTVKLVKRLGGN